MPLLVCPNDGDSMQALRRSGVEFDICPTCRGVWLDRGELESLMAIAGDEGPGPRNDQALPWPETGGPEPSQGPDETRARDADDDYRRKRWRPSLFDIFD